VAAVRSSGGSNAWRRVSLIAGGFAVLFAGTTIWLARGAIGSAASSSVTRFTVTAPSALGQKLILTPDQRTVVVQMSGQLYRRNLDELDIIPIPATENSFQPFLSPDGDWLAYFHTGENVLKRVRLDGSGLQTIGPAPTTQRSGGWGEDGTIVFNSSGLGGLNRVLAAGGEPEPIVSDVVGGGLAWLDLLPGGRAVLGGQLPQGGALGDWQIFVVPLDTGRRQFLVDGTNPQYVRTGHVMYWREGSLWIVPFDVERLQLTGPPALVAEAVRAGTNGAANFVASERVLVYRPGAVAGVGSGRPVWVDRAGNVEPLPVDAGLYSDLRISPDGTRVVMARLEQDWNVWVYDETSLRSTQLTFEAGHEQMPIWTPDGERIIYSAARGDSEFALISVRADGSGEALELMTSPAAVSLRASESFGHCRSCPGRRRCPSRAHQSTSRTRLSLRMEGSWPTSLLRRGTSRSSSTRSRR
jgi:hypothetical protein